MRNWKHVTKRSWLILRHYTIHQEREGLRKATKPLTLDTQYSGWNRTLDLPNMQQNGQQLHHDARYCAKCQSEFYRLYWDRLHNGTVCSTECVRVGQVAAKSRQHCACCMNEQFRSISTHVVKMTGYCRCSINWLEPSVYSKMFSTLRKQESEQEER
jgi:hypothetical protein